MKNLTLEVYVDPENRIVRCFYEAPAYGSSHDIKRGFVQSGVLNDGVHRVKFAIFNAMLPIEQIKALARMAVSGDREVWQNYRSN